MQPTKKKDPFFDLDSVFLGVLHHEQLQRQLFSYIINSANKVVSTHCETQQAHLQDISEDPRIDDSHQFSINECNSRYQAASQKTAETLDEIDTNVSEVVGIDEQVQEFILFLEDEKLAAAIESEKKALQHRSEELATGAVLIIAGALMLGLTAGYAAADGLAFIVEGMDGVRKTVNASPAKPNALAISEPIDNLALRQFQDRDEKNRELFINSWIEIVDRHAQMQRDSLGLMADSLPLENPHRESLILLQESYNEKAKAIVEIKNESSLEKKLVRIQTVANSVQETDERAKNFIHQVKADLPQPVKSEADVFLDRAQQFYENNQKMIRFAGLMLITAVGIALMVATGGIAAAIGTAILGAVAFKPVKSLGHHATHFLADCFFEKKEAQPDQEKEKALIAELKTHAAEHCDKQNKLLDALDIEKESAALVSAHLVAPKYDLFLGQLEKADSIEAVEQISSQIERQDQTLSRQIKNKNSKNEFNQNAARFKKENTEIFSMVGKVVLAAAALTVVGIATGGIGVAAALGFAAASWLVSKAIKTVRESLADKPKIEKKSDKVVDEREGEGQQGLIPRE